MKTKFLIITKKHLLQLPLQQTITPHLNIIAILVQKTMPLVASLIADIGNRARPLLVVLEGTLTQQASINNGRNLNRNPHPHIAITIFSKSHRNKKDKQPKLLLHKRSVYNRKCMNEFRQRQN